MYEKKNIVLMVENLDKININSLVNLSNEVTYIEEKIKTKLRKIKKEKIKKASKKISECVKENENKFYETLTNEEKKKFENVWNRFKLAKEKTEDKKRVVYKTESNQLFLFEEDEEGHKYADELKMEEWKAIYVDMDIIEKGEEKKLIKEILKKEIEKNK